MGTTNMSLTVLPYDLDNSLLGRVPSTDIHCNAAGSIKTCCCLYAFQSHFRQPTHDYKKIRAPLKAPRPLPFRRPRLLGSESTSEGLGSSDYIRSVYHVVTMQKSSRIMRMLLKVAMGPLMDSKKLSVSV